MPVEGRDEGLTSRLFWDQLGILSQDRGDLGAAERWYARSLEIKERLGDEPGAAYTYHQLGKVAHARGDLAAAERGYTKALATWTKTGNQQNRVKAQWLLDQLRGKPTS